MNEQPMKQNVAPTTIIIAVVAILGVCALAFFLLNRSEPSSGGLSKSPAEFEAIAKQKGDEYAKNMQMRHQNGGGGSQGYQSGRR